MRTLKISNKETGTILVVVGFLGLITLMFGFENSNWMLKVLCICVQFFGVYFLIKGMNKKEVRIRVITALLMLIVVVVYLMF